MSEGPILAKYGTRFFWWLRFPVFPVWVRLACGWGTAHAAPPRSRASCVRECQPVEGRDAGARCLVCEGGLGLGKVVGGLQVDEVARVEFEEAAKADGGIRCDGAAAREDFTQAALRDAGCFRGGKLRDAKRLKKFLAQYDSGMCV